MQSVAATSAIPIHFGVNLPRYLQVEVTSRCNLACKMCPLTLGSTLSSSNEGNLGELPWEQVKKYAVEVGQVLFSGFGEPMTNAQFPSMLRELDTIGVATSFSTNGIGVEHLAGMLSTLHRLTHVNVSIDSPDPVLYRQIRGGDLARVWKGLRSLCEALPGRVSVSSVAMVSNLESLRAFPAMLGPLGVKDYVIQPMVDWSSAMLAERLYTREWHDNAIAAIRVGCRSQNISFGFAPQTEQEVLKPVEAIREYRLNNTLLRKETRNCPIPYESVYVDSGGRVFPCCHSAGATGVLGNLHEHSLFEIFNGPAARKFREDLLAAATTPAVCRACNVAQEAAHTYREFRARLSDCSFNDGLYRVEAQNIGTAVWNRKTPVRIGTQRPQDRQSSSYDGTWLSPSRVTEMVEDQVRPGERATFRFSLNRSPEALPEWFQLLAEYKVWLPETHFLL